MRSGTSLFSPGIFRRNLMRFWPIWAVYILVWLLLLPAGIGARAQYATAMEARASILETGVITAPVMCGIFSCVSAMAVFGFMYQSRSACMMGGLPVRREGVYITSVLSGLIWLLCSGVAVFLVGLAVSAATGIGAAGVLLQWLAMVSLETLLFYGFACLCAMLTGHILVLPLVYAILNLTACVVEYLADMVVRILVYGGTSFSSDSLTFLSPVMRLLTSSGVERVYGDAGRLVSCGYSDWTLLALYGLAGLVCMAGGLLIYRRRQLETASDVVAVRCLKPVFKYCMAFGCALGLGLLLYKLVFESFFTQVGSAAWLVVCTVFGGFVGYFAAEMLIKKSFRAFGHAWKGFAIFTFAAIAILLCLEADVFGYERRIPAAGEVESVVISCRGETSELKQRENIDAALALHGEIVSHKSDSEEALLKMEERGTDDSIYTEIEYKLKGGGRLKRVYYIPYYDGDLRDGASLAGRASDILNSDEAVELRNRMEVPISEETVDYACVSWYDPEQNAYTQLSLTEQEAVELYESCILPDIADGGMGRIWIVYDEDYQNSVYACQISIDTGEKRASENGEPEYMYSYFYEPVTAHAFRTIDWLARRGVEPVLERNVEW